MACDMMIVPQPKRRPELALDGSGIVLMCMQLGKTCLKR